MPKVTSAMTETIVRAGAGAGKTYTLVREVIGQAKEFRQEHQRWPNTVVTTFTRKATQELRERIIKYCIDEAPEAIEFAHSHNSLIITTMHGLLDRFLRSHGRVLGLPSQFKIGDDSDASLLRKKVVRQLFNDNEQWSPLLEEFTFKTIGQILRRFESLTSREQSQFARADDQLQAAQTLMKAKQAELKDILNQTRPFMTTDKGLEYVGALERLAQASVDDWSQFLKEIEQGVASLAKRPASKDPNNTDELKKRTTDILKFFKEIPGDPLWNPEHWLSGEKYYQLFTELSPHYLELLRGEKVSRGEIEIGDLEDLALNILEKHPEVLLQFGQSYDQWFIDEYQDTSPIQIQLLRPMMTDSQVYMVGDPQQSIYLFRGARSEIFAETEAQVRAGDGKVDTLPNNYRSQASLLQSFNFIFPKIDSEFSTMEPKVESTDPLAVEVYISDFGRESDQHELNQLVSNIAKLLEQGVAPNDIAVLCRKRDQLDIIEQKLLGLGYPTLSHVNSGFFQRQEIQDAMAFLSVLVNPADDFSLVQFLRSPFFPIDDRVIVEIIGDSKEKFWPRFREYFTNHNFAPGTKLIEYQELVKQVGVGFAFRKGLVEFGFFETSHWLDSSGRREANLWKLINQVEKESREPGTAILRFLKDDSNKIDVDGAQAEDASSAIVPDKINLMTVHASKGLEFDHVFLPFMGHKTMLTDWVNFAQEEQMQKWSLRLPLGEFGESISTPLEKLTVNRLKAREVAEVDRLLYVAMTRAKRKLYMSWGTYRVDKYSWVPKIEKVLDISPGVHERKEFQYQVSMVKEAEPPEFVESHTKFTLPEPYQLVEEKDFAQAKSGLQRPMFKYEDYIESQHKRAFGVFMHSYFEKLKVLEPNQVRELIEREVTYKVGEVLEAFDYVVQLAEPNILEIIRVGEVEWFFQKIVDGEKSEGRIDLWGIDHETLYVIDYKTGSSKFKEKAFEQLGEYARVLQESKPFMEQPTRVELVALYPFEKALFSQEFN